MGAKSCGSGRMKDLQKQFAKETGNKHISNEVLLCSKWLVKYNEWLEQTVFADKLLIKSKDNALKFYADKKRWDKEYVISHQGIKCYTYRPRFSTKNDHGDIARQGLGND